MEEQVTKFTKSCSSCQQVKGDNGKRSTMHRTVSDLPFKKVAIDYFGPLSRSSKSFIHILVVIDRFIVYLVVIAYIGHADGARPPSSFT